MNKSRRIKVDQKYERMDKYLVNKLNLPRSQINKLHSVNCILVNQTIPHKLGVELFKDDIIEILEPSIETKTLILATEIPLDIKYEDDDLMIVYKPSGMLTHPTQFNESDTLLNSIYHYAKEKFRPRLIHRLDKDTAGLIIFAKTQNAEKLLLTMMENREIIKKYYAIVNGSVKKDKMIIDVPIARANDNRLKMVAGEGKNAKRALTEFTVLKRWQYYSLLDLILHTGRTHQIRVHLKYINHSIVNDPLYSNHQVFNSYHQYLMAYYLKFKHPITLKQVEISIDQDQAFLDFQKELATIIKEK